MFLQGVVEAIDQLRPGKLLLHLFSKEIAQFVGDLAMHVADPIQLEVVELQTSIRNDGLQLQPRNECRRLYVYIKQISNKSWCGCDGAVTVMVAVTVHIMPRLLSIW